MVLYLVNNPFFFVLFQEVMSAENHCRSIGTQTEEGAAISHGESGGFRSETEKGTGSLGESASSEKFQSEMKGGAGSFGGSRGLKMNNI
jgi:hypothetical protein